MPASSIFVFHRVTCLSVSLLCAAQAASVAATRVQVRWRIGANSRETSTASCKLLARHERRRRAREEEDDGNEEEEEEAR